MKTNYTPRNILVTTGEYTGNDTENRAIPHSLGRLPNAVLIAAKGNSNMYHILGKDPTLIRKDNAAALVVTTMDTTNFYVGDAAGYANSANLNTVEYVWTAF